MYQTGYYATPYYYTGYHLGAPAAPIVYGYATYQDLVLEAREQLGDTAELCYRYPDAMLVSILNRGLQELDRIRPDSFYDLYDRGVPEVTDLNPGAGQTEWTELFAPEMRFYPAVVEYVVGMTQVSEDPYIETGNAERILTMFRTLVLSV